VVNADDPGQANFVMSVGALGNASDTPLDGSHDMSFGESTVDEEYTVDGEDTASILAAHNIPMTYSQNDPNVLVVDSTIMDPEMIGALMSRRSVVDPSSPTSTVQFNKQVAVKEHVLYSEARHLHLGQMLPCQQGTQGALNHLAPHRVILCRLKVVLHHLNP